MPRLGPGGEKKMEAQAPGTRPEGPGGQGKANQPEEEPRRGQWRGSVDERERGREKARWELGVTACLF